MEGKESLDLADDLAAGGIGLEHLPDPAPEGAGQGKDALAGMISRAVLWKQKVRERRAEALLDLRERSLANLAQEGDGAESERGEP
jgi:hypothetical protein